MKRENRIVAYFSMEICLDERVPTYSGGLGILAGDTIRSAANLKIPMVAISLLYRNGYFSQKLDEKGRQTEESLEWVVQDFLVECPERVTVTIEGRDVQVRAWKYKIFSESGFIVPVFLLDTDLPENSEEDRKLTHQLYGGDQRYRLCQEAILGIGGVRMLRALGYHQLTRFHMNEGHSSLLTLELLDESKKKRLSVDITKEDIHSVKSLCVFTTHTPVDAGHDKFPMDLVKQVLGYRSVFDMKDVFCCEGILNMTYLALNLSHYVNGVAKKHGEVTQLMFANYSIHAITNGVHLPSWTSPSFQKLFDQYIPGWRSDNYSLRYALNIARTEIWKSHLKAKEELLQYVKQETNTDLDMDCLTIGFARRSTPYKRADLLLTDLDRLIEIVKKSGKIQIIYAGKAHPQDEEGKQIIQKIFQAIKFLKEKIKIVYLENYDIALGKLMTSGVDVWLNTPKRPLEASGTSGMKSAVNGVPSLSILDGWWVEGCIEGITGWAIGNSSEQVGHDEADDLYDKLENVILPLFYHDRDGFIEVMTHCIALNGSFFNTNRMMHQYVLNAYFL